MLLSLSSSNFFLCREAGSIESGKELEKGEAFQDLPGSSLPGVREELIQDQGIARNFFNGKPDAGI
jgi:hypothetical protein